MKIIKIKDPLVFYDKLVRLVKFEFTCLLTLPPQDSASTSSAIAANSTGLSYHKMCRFSMKFKCLLRNCG